MLKDKKPTLRLLFISSDKYPPIRVDVSVLFGEELVHRGYKIDWILQSEGDCSERHVKNWKGATIWVGATDNGNTLFSRVRKHWRSIRNDLSLFSLVKNNNYDFIQVKDKFLSALFAIRSAKRRNTKFFYWLSFPYPEAYEYRYRDGTARYPILYLIRGAVSKYLLYQVILPHADHIFVQSEQMKRDISAKGIPVSKLTAVPMGVDLKSIPLQSDVRPEVHSILYLGALDRVRHIDFLIRVFAKVREELPQARLYLVGASDDESDERFLKDEVAKYKLGDSVVFVGFVPILKAWEYVQRANVCVSPIYPTPIFNPASPTKLVEYMAMGKPVVANDHPEQALVIAESEAGLCVPYDEQDFCDAVVWVLQNPAMADEMGNKGRKYVEQHRAYNVIAEKLDHKYREQCSA